MTTANGYVELHLHTAYSFLDGASLPEELVGRAADLGYQALAITDHDGLYGAMEFARLAHDVGIQPITGAEVTLIDGSHLTLIALNRAGYANLCRLITAAHRVGRADRAPRLDPTLLPSHAEGLVLLTGCRQSKLAQLVDAGRYREAEQLVREYVTWFGPDDVIIELQHNLVFGDTERVRRLVQLAEHCGLRYAATGNVHYHDPHRHRLHDVLVAIRHRTTLDQCHQQRRPNAMFALRPAEEMARLFARYPAALETTRWLASRCTFNLATDLAYTFPSYPTADGETPDDLLARICWAELAQRYPENRERAEARLREELAVIRKHGLAGFFLLYRDLLLLAREVAEEVRGQGSAQARHKLPPGRGRGSSVSSIVCYLIGLSHVDPLAHQLFFGRFLNDEMASVPDIDLDFPREIRERLIERVYERYGHDHAALVCAFATYKLRSAVRDVGKALGLPQPELDKIAKLSEPRSADALRHELERIPGYADKKDAPPWRYLVELSEQLAGFPRHVTQHVGGMIISSSPLCEFVPIQPAAMEGRFICQWDKDSCDDARVVKIDFLALGMLSLVEECLELIVASGKPPVDLSRIPFDDACVYNMICAGDTIGVFQIESRAQIQMLPRTRPRCLEDLVVQVAIVRPGPIVGGAVKPYVAHRQRERTSFLPVEPHYDHPCLEPVLRETHGVILFQEQVLQVAMALAGFTAGQADMLRRSMSRKRSREAMLRLWQDFRTGALRNGVPVETAKAVFQKLLGFASYGFPKAHAAAFAVLAYQSCWLKRYYPAEFTCALLNNQPMGFYPPHVLIGDAKRHGLRVLPPDINQSGVRCSVEGSNGIRIGLGFVKGLGEELAQHIVREREANGPYRSLADVVRRVPVATELAERLILVGAFDRFGLGRREALWQLGLLIPPRRFGAQRALAHGRQMPLALPVEHDGVELRPMNAWEQVAADYDLLELSPRYHPLGLLRPHLPKHLVTTADLDRLPDGALIQLAGLVVCRQRPATAKGVTFLLVEDERGLANVIVYPRLYEEARLTVRGEPFLLVEGTLRKQEGTINILAHWVAPLEAARREFEMPDARGREDGTNTPGTAPETERTLAAIAPEAHNYR
ncbi:MAG: error-prone DNA polymerase [Thermomicrobiales bacterium]|nr:MAG: error-prone DNA polymerase [Thermomicrobiales bacterium]